LGSLAIVGIPVRTGSPISATWFNLTEDNDLLQLTGNFRDSVDWTLLFTQKARIRAKASDKIACVVEYSCFEFLFLPFTKPVEADFY